MWILALQAFGWSVNVGALIVRIGCRGFLFGNYNRSPKVGNPIASILKKNVYRIPALFGLNPVSNFMGFTV